MAFSSSRQILKQATRLQSKPSCLLQKRLKTYLVGVDGSSYGFSALKNAAMTIKDNDKLLAIHFPVNIAAV